MDSRTGRVSGAGDALVRRAKTAPVLTKYVCTMHQRESDSITLTRCTKSGLFLPCVNAKWVKQNANKTPAVTAEQSVGTLRNLICTRRRFDL
jgi:hypothetical protein